MGNATQQEWRKAYVLNVSDDGGITFVEHTNTCKFTPDMVSRVMDSPAMLYGLQSNNPTADDMVHVIAVSDNEGDDWQGKAGPCPEGVGDPLTYPDSIPMTCGGVADILQVWTE